MWEYGIKYPIGSALTEDRLINYLNLIYPETNDWIHDKNLGKFRPDYYSPSLKITVEYNGPTHYTSPSTILRDRRKMQYLKPLDITMISIPYFIQLDSNAIKILFNREVTVERKYPHGFISKMNTYILPASYCPLGVDRFLLDMKQFKGPIVDEIKSNLLLRLKEEEFELVLTPYIYQNLFEDKKSRPKDKT